MSYGKKDEDADLGLVKVDRTQVFQEGESATIPHSTLRLIGEVSHVLTVAGSTIVQQFANPAKKMPYPPDQDCAAALYGREVSDERSHDSVLRHLEALPEQRCQLATDGPPCYQGAVP
jgi:hypothetical protein